MKVFHSRLSSLCRKNRHHSEKKVIASLCTSLLMTYVFFLVGLDGSPGTPSCKMAAVMVHYSLLSSFSWMFVLALSVYLAIHELIFRLSDDINVKKSALFSWGMYYGQLYTRVLLRSASLGKVYHIKNLSVLMSLVWISLQKNDHEQFHLKNKHNNEE